MVMLPNSVESIFMADLRLNGFMALAVGAQGEETGQLTNHLRLVISLRTHWPLCTMGCCDGPCCNLAGADIHSASCPYRPFGLLHAAGGGIVRWRRTSFAGVSGAATMAVRPMHPDRSRWRGNSAWCCVPPPRACRRQVPACRWRGCR